MEFLKKLNNKQALNYLILIFLTTLGFLFTFRVWKYDYTTYPLVYEHDGLEVIKEIKQTLETRDYWLSTASLGAPFSSNLYLSFPIADQAFIATISILSLITQNHFLILNIYIFLTYILVAISAFWVLKKLKLNNYLTIIGSLIFTFLPYHQIRVSVGHIFLLPYFTIPLMVYWAFALTEKGFALKKYLSSKKIIETLIIAILISTVGMIYYPFFAVGLLLMAGTIGFLWHKNRQSLLGGIILSILIIAITSLNIMPGLLFQTTQSNNFTIDRNPLQVEEFGLRLSRILIPLPNGKPALIKKFLTPYYQNVQHEQFQYLGLIGVIGFFYLLKELALTKQNKYSKAAALLMIGLVFWGLTGGLAYIFSFFVSASFRAIGRISVLIAFLSIWAILDWWQKINLVFSKNKKIVFNFLFLMVVGISLFEQTQVIDPHQTYWEIKKEFDENQAMMQKVENSLPKESMIFQLPYMKYPEANGQCALDSYDLFLGYLHSQNLKWSFGTVVGSEGAIWHNWVTKLPAQQLLPTLAIAEFDGIYIDMNGCIDGWQWWDTISKITDGQMLNSDNKRLIFINIYQYAQNLRNSFTSEELAERRKKILQPVNWQPDQGFSNINRHFRGINLDMGQEGTILLNNPQAKAETIAIDFTMKIKDRDKATLEIIYGDVITEFSVNNQNSQVSLSLEIVPGKSKLIFKTKAGDQYYLKNFSFLQTSLNFTK